MPTLKNIRPRIRPATVIATIALFVALGGGYAMAFSGSGQLQKGGVIGIDDDLEDVRTLAGIGRISAICLGGDVEVDFFNGSGEALNMQGLSNDGNFEVNNGAPNQLYGLSDATDGINMLDVLLSPADGSKAPQADLKIAVKETGNCATSYVTVLALNTQG